MARPSGHTAHPSSKSLFDRASAPESESTLSTNVKLECAKPAQASLRRKSPFFWHEGGRQYARGGSLRYRGGGFNAPSHPTANPQEPDSDPDFSQASSSVQSSPDMGVEYQHAPLAESRDIWAPDGKAEREVCVWGREQAPETAGQASAHSDR